MRLDMARIVFISILLLSPVFATGALGDSGSAANPELVFQYRGPHPRGWIGQHLEDFAILSDQSLAIAVSEGPAEYFLYQVSPDGRSMHRTLLGEGAGNTSVDRAVAAALLTTPAREAQPSSPAQREDVIVANSAGQVWRIAPTGEVVWFTAVGPDFGLWLVTSMRVLRDGSILLGGRGDSDGPRWCGYDAQVIKLRSDGQPVWQWHFDLPDTWTYVNQLIERDRGYLVLVGTSGPGAEMGSSSNACADFSDRQWFAWLDSAGNPEFILARPFSAPVDRLALLPAGRIAASGVDRQSGRVFLRLFQHDGRGTIVQRSQSLVEISGAPRDLVPDSVIDMSVISQRLYLFVNFHCSTNATCAAKGTRAIAFSLDGELLSPPQASIGALNEVSISSGGSAYLQRRFGDILRMPLE